MYLLSCYISACLTLLIVHSKARCLRTYLHVHAFSHDHDIRSLCACARLSIFELCGIWPVPNRNLGKTIFTVDRSLHADQFAMVIKVVSLIIIALTIRLSL